MSVLCSVNGLLHEICFQIPDRVGSAADDHYDLEDAEINKQVREIVLVALVIHLDIFLLILIAHGLHDFCFDFLDALFDRSEVALAEAALLLHLFLLRFFHVEFFTFLGRSLVTVEVTGEFDLRLDLAAGNKHGVGEAYANLKLTTSFRLVLIDIIGPHDASVEALAALLDIIDLQLKAIHMLLQVLIVVISDLLVENIESHLKSL